MKKLLLITGLTLLTSGCLPPESSGRQEKLETVSVSIVSPDRRILVVKAEVADTAQSRERGLMYRTSLDAFSGMLFVFSNEAPQSFWMKNTTIPLDIIFADRDGIVVGLAAMAPCTADPCPKYSSGVPVQYALEVPQGFIARHGVDEIWQLRWEGGPQ